MKHTLRALLLPFLGLCLLGNFQSVVAQALETQFACTVQAVPAKASLLEPVRLNFKLQYNGSSPIQASLPQWPEDRISILVRRADSPPQSARSYSGSEFHTAALVDAALLKPHTLAPGTSSVFPIVLLYSWQANQFVFETPGTYEISVSGRFLLADEKGEAQEKVATAQTVVIIEDHQGDDVPLWRDAVLAGGVIGPGIREKRKLVTHSMRELAQNHPHSPYRPYALAWQQDIFPLERIRMVQSSDGWEERIGALERFLAENPYFAWNDHFAAALGRRYATAGEAEKLQTLADSVLNDEWVPSLIKDRTRKLKPNPPLRDMRLDQNVTYHFPQQTPITEVLKELTRQTGVALNVNSELEKRTIAAPQRTQPLRSFMATLSASNAVWVSEGEGYRLVALESR